MAARQLLHKTLAQLRRWDTGDLQGVIEGLHALLEERAREDAAPPNRAMTSFPLVRN